VEERIKKYAVEVCEMLKRSILQRLERIRTGRICLFFHRNCGNPKKIIFRTFINCKLRQLVIFFHPEIANLIDLEA